MRSARVRLFTWIALGALCSSAAWARAAPDPARREAGRAIEQSAACWTTAQMEDWRQRLAALPGDPAREKAFLEEVRAAARQCWMNSARKLKKRGGEYALKEGEACWPAAEAQAWRQKLDALPDDPEAVTRFVNKELWPAVNGCEQAKRAAAEEAARQRAEAQKAEKARRKAEREAEQRAEFEWVIKPRFDYAWDFAANGLARVVENGKYGYINAEGKVVIAPRFDDAGHFAANGLAWVEVKGKAGYINAEGKVVIEPRFDDTRSFAANGLAQVRVNGKYGYIDEKGKVVIEPRFDRSEENTSELQSPERIE
jgi:hypothetical protein